MKENEEAKDIVQTAFIKLWEKKDQVSIGQSGQYYLYKSVYHLCLNSLRNKKVKEKRTEKLSAAVPSTNNVTDEKETSARVLTAIETLPPKCKEVFLKSRHEGKRYGEIANELNISVKTVEAQMGKALKILRNLLADLIKT